MRRLAFAALALLLSPVLSRAEICPTNSFATGGTGYFEDTSTAPRASWFGFAYDLVAGTVQGGHTGSGEAGSFAQLTAQDRYTIVGPTSATPVQFLVRCRFTGTVGGALVNLPFGGPTCLGSQALLRITSASLSDEATVASDPCGPRAFDETLELELAKLPGEEFTLAALASLTAGHTIEATASGLISFVNLPPGYSVQSCQGYAGVPVAVRPRSWGAVKQLYR